VLAALEEEAALRPNKLSGRFAPDVLVRLWKDFITA